MEQATKDLLKKVIDEYTDKGDALNLLATDWRYRDDVVWWLRNQRLEGEGPAAMLEQDEPFGLDVKDGLVWLCTGPGYSQREILLDYKERDP